MEHPSTHRVNSAGQVEKVTKVDAVTSRTEFAETDDISIYLLAINIHDMQQVMVVAVKTKKLKTWRTSVF